MSNCFLVVSLPPYSGYWISCALEVTSKDLVQCRLSTSGKNTAQVILDTPCCILVRRPLLGMLSLLPWWRCRLPALAFVKVNGSLGIGKSPLGWRSGNGRRSYVWRVLVALCLWRVLVAFVDRSYPNQLFHGGLQNGGFPILSFLLPLEAGILWWRRLFFHELGAASPK